MEQENTPDIVCFGGIIYDFFNYVDEFPKVGESKLSYKSFKSYGGKGANCIVQSALLGNKKCALIARVGKDSFGYESIQNLQKYGIITDYIKEDEDGSTSLAFVTINNSGVNFIVVSAGTISKWTEQELQECSVAFKKCQIFISSFEVDLESLKWAHEYLDEVNTDVFSLLVTAPYPESSIGMKDLPRCDMICMNEVEAALLCSDGDSKKCLNITNYEEAKEILTKMFEQLPSNKIKWIVITLGELGAIYGRYDGYCSRLIEAPQVNAIDTTGAGDSFVGCLAHQISCFNKSELEIKMDDIISTCVKVASFSTTKSGTIQSYIDSMEKLPF